MIALLIMREQEESLYYNDRIIYDVWARSALDFVTVIALLIMYFFSSFIFISCGKPYQRLARTTYWSNCNNNMGTSNNRGS